MSDASNYQEVNVPMPVIKLASAWAAVGLAKFLSLLHFIGITSWAEGASALAALYTGLLVAEWFWKKFWRPVFVRFGWMTSKDRL